MALPQESARPPVARANVILEMVDGDIPEKNLRCLATFGRMVVFGATSGERGSSLPP